MNLLIGRGIGSTCFDKVLWENWTKGSSEWVYCRHQFKNRISRAWRLITWLLRTLVVIRGKKTLKFGSWASIKLCTVAISIRTALSFSIVSSLPFILYDKHSRIWSTQTYLSFNFGFLDGENWLFEGEIPLRMSELVLREKRIHLFVENWGLDTNWRVLVIGG